MEARRGFDRSAASVARARLFVAAALQDGGVSTPAVIEPALLAVSELATNAVQHTRSGFEVVVDTAPSVRITVIDGSPQLPHLRPTHLWEEGGRGVPIIDATAARWGVECDGDGKAVWWEVDLPPM